MVLVLWLFACIQTDLYEELSDEVEDSCPDSGAEVFEDTGL